MATRRPLRPRWGKHWREHVGITEHMTRTTWKPGSLRVALPIKMLVSLIEEEQKPDGALAKKDPSTSARDISRWREHFLFVWDLGREQHQVYIEIPIGVVMHLLREEARDPHGTLTEYRDRLERPRAKTKRRK